MTQAIVQEIILGIIAGVLSVGSTVIGAYLVKIHALVNSNLAVQIEINRKSTEALAAANTTIATQASALATIFAGTGKHE